MPLLNVEPDSFLFSPLKAETQRRAVLRLARRTPSKCGNRVGTNRKRSPQRTPGDRYTTASYRRAITRGCLQAFPPPEHLARGRVKAAKGTRWETDSEWRKRHGADGWKELRAWQRAHHWSPNQLRHNAATELRKQFGIEAARVVLGHSSAVVTEIYAEMDFAKAQQIMADAG